MSDRSTYRMYEDERLIEEAKYNPNRELAIALGERLEDVLAELDYKIGEHKELYADAQREGDRLEEKVFELQREIDKLEMALEQRDRVIEQLTKGN